MYHELKAYPGSIMNSNQSSYFLSRLCLAYLTTPHCLFSTGAADTCQVTVRQPRYQEAEYSTQTVSLPCAFSASECSLSKPQVLWFRFFTNKHEDLCTPKCTNDQKFKVQISENSIALQINDLSVNDNAVYFCGIAFSDSSSPHSKRTGNGTVLTKRGQKMLYSVLSNHTLHPLIQTLMAVRKEVSTENEKQRNCRLVEICSTEHRVSELGIHWSKSSKMF
uniref:Immunoglobulin superfamily member 6 n=1 Tax=Anser cygnoides TaxID=8845 RepID=A0A8B9DR38_ANSCY